MGAKSGLGPYFVVAYRTLHSVGSFRQMRGSPGGVHNDRRYPSSILALPVRSIKF
jgi:hypothetical protein